MSRLVSLCVLAALSIGGFGRVEAGTIYYALLDGPSEAPPNASPGTGTALVEIDLVAHTLSVQTSFSGLIGTTTVAHIHSATVLPFEGTAGVATQTPTFEGFPAGVSSGSYSRVFDTTLASTFRAGFLAANGGTAAGAEAALAASMAAGTAYLNIHSNLFPGGEIRGFLRPIPEPGTLSLALIGGLGLVLLARLRGSRASVPEGGLEPPRG